MDYVYYLLLVSFKAIEAEVPNFLSEIYYIPEISRKALQKNIT